MAGVPGDSASPLSGSENVSSNDWAEWHGIGKLSRVHFPVRKQTRDKWVHMENSPENSIQLYSSHFYPGQLWGRLGGTEVPDTCSGQQRNKVTFPLGLENETEWRNNTKQKRQGMQARGRGTKLQPRLAVDCQSLHFLQPRSFSSSISRNGPFLPLPFFIGSQRANLLQEHAASSPGPR